MEKEEIEKAKGHLEWLLDNGILASEDEPHIENILKYIRYLEQKESILDKVTEYCKRFEYETEPIEDDDYLSERALVCEDILEIIEGEKKNGK